MRTILLAAAAILSMSACSKGDVRWPSPTATAALKAAGLTEAVLERPNFSCGQTAAVVTGPNALAVPVWTSTPEHQSGWFFRAKLNGVPVRGAVCIGSSQPSRVNLTTPRYLVPVQP